MYDVVATAPRRPRPGETLIGTSLATYVGGKGFNQAVAASRAGAKTAMVGRLGRDGFGAEFRGFLDNERIDATHVVIDAEHGTGVGLPVVETNAENSIIVVPRANLAVSTDDINAARSTIENASVLLLQLELNSEPTTYAARIAHEAGTKVILNPAPLTTPPLEMMPYVDILVPNEGELHALASQDGNATIFELAESVQEAWNTTLVVTLGMRGALVVSPDQRPETLAGHGVEAIDTIGAGDVFCGNLGARLALGSSLEEAVAFANAAAAIAVTRRGGAPSAPRAAETRAFLANGETQPASLASVRGWTSP